MNWLAVLKAVLSIAGLIAKTAHDKQLLTAGEYKVIANANQKSIDKIRAAIVARDSGMLDPNDAANK